MKIKTNRHWKELLCVDDIPTKAQEDFDYIKDDERFSPRIFKYRGHHYDANDFITTTPGPWNHGLPKDFEGWDGYASDSFFSGVLIRFSPEDDYDRDAFGYVQVGTYYN